MSKPGWLDVDDPLWIRWVALGKKLDELRDRLEKLKNER